MSQQQPSEPSGHNSLFQYFGRRTFLKFLSAQWLAWSWLRPTTAHAMEPAQPFGTEFPKLDHFASGEWWKIPVATGKNPKPIIDMNVPRDQVVAFALYTHDNGVLKITACLFPLKPDEARTARLEFQWKGKWEQVLEVPVVYPGWNAHFKIKNWDSSLDVPYRVCHGETASFEGFIRHDPIEKDEIVVANMSCNSSRTKGARVEIIENLKFQNPDLLFFAGDQSYHHTEHTSGFLEFGLQFREIIKDRPTITIPDDHDIGQPNLWGEDGKVSTLSGNADGGYMYPGEYVNMVQRAQTWHLPDPYDATPIKRDITVYYTNLKVGGIDFAILEDRKFKSGPAGKIPQMGPRPDHINDESYDPESINLPGLKLLGDRQHKFLEDWTQNWTGCKFKVVLSQTAFCGAVHLHGTPDNRLLADLDCNGWPQTGRNEALRLIRQAWAPHLAGDQHLAVLMKQGIDQFDDGPYAFTSPALVNTIYGRWWHPKDEQAGPNPVPNSPLPWTGNFKDGLGNKITVYAYANPVDVKAEKERADGYGMVRFNKVNRTMTVECWPRFSDAKQGDQAQFPGWPMNFAMRDNDGRKIEGYLPELQFQSLNEPVVQVMDDTSKEIMYTVRIDGQKFAPPVYATGTYSIRYGKDKPEILLKSNIIPGEKDQLPPLVIN